MDRDYIIVGQGLAGSVLALILMQKGKKVVIINKTDENCSSRVAAGIYNPITGKEMKKTWQADKLFPFLAIFYAYAEQVTGRKFFHPRPIYRPFLSIQEQNEWMAKSADEQYMPYVERVYGKSKYSPFVNDPFGGILLKQSGYLDIPEFLDATKDYLKAHDSYKEEFFDESQMQFQEKGVTYKGIAAKKVIYCNGLSAASSTYFEWLPYRPVKGEILFLQFFEPCDVIFNRGVFMLPLPGGITKVGATYNWQDISVQPTETGKKELVEKVIKLTDLTFEIKGQIAGIRPATKDRRPFIGLHPKHEPLGIFNGLGTKGVSLAPYFASRFSDFLERKTALDPEVKINRFF